MDSMGLNRVASILAPFFLLKVNLIFFLVDK